MLLVILYRSERWQDLFWEDRDIVMFCVGICIVDYDQSGEATGMLSKHLISSLKLQSSFQTSIIVAY